MIYNASLYIILNKKKEVTVYVLNKYIYCTLLTAGIRSTTIPVLLFPAFQRHDTAHRLATNTFVIAAGITSADADFTAAASVIGGGDLLKTVNNGNQLFYIDMNISHVPLYYSNTLNYQIYITKQPYTNSTRNQHTRYETIYIIS